MASTNWVYVRSESQLWTVGFYSPDGEWHPDTDWDSKEEAAKRVHYLNGRSNEKETINAELLEACHYAVSYLDGRHSNGILARARLQQVIRKSKEQSNAS